MPCAVAPGTSRAPEHSLRGLIAMAAVLFSSNTCVISSFVPGESEVATTTAVLTLRN
jgi:hypothetical protein